MYYCKNCGSQIEEQDVNIDMMVGRCRNCSGVIDFSDHPSFRDRSYELVEKYGKRRLEVPMPASITVEQLGRNLKITRKWFNFTYIFLAFFCVAWDSFLVFWYAMAFASFLKNPAAIMMCIFPVLHLAVGVGLTYSTVAGFFNKTTVETSDSELSVTHGPVPWWGNQKISPSDLEQLYCQEVKTRTKHGYSTSYSVNAILKSDHRKVTLLKGLTEMDQALFIEQEVEKHLDIEDRHVPGELHK